MPKKLNLAKLAGQRSPVTKGNVFAFPHETSDDYLIGVKEKLEKRSLGVQGLQVRAFILMSKLHDYLDAARREFETNVGTRLCQEFCCCKATVPFVTRLEAEYIISRTGYYSDLVAIAEQWLVARHDFATTYPTDQPTIMGGPVTRSPQVATEFGRVRQSRCPFLLAPDHPAHRSRFLSGRYVNSHFTSGENWCLLEDVQPLSCLTTGLTKFAPDTCQRSLGFGETDGLRAVADPATLKRYVRAIDQIYDQVPDKGNFAFLPTAIMLVANPARMQTIIERGDIALAKLGVGSKQWPEKLWEEDTIYGPAPRKTIYST